MSVERLHDLLGKIESRKRPAPPPLASWLGEAGMPAPASAPFETIRPAPEEELELILEPESHRDVEAEAAARADAEAKARAEAEAKARADAEAKARAEAEAKTRAEAEAKARAEAEARADAETLEVAPIVLPAPKASGPIVASAPSARTTFGALVARTLALRPRE